MKKYTHQKWYGNYYVFESDNDIPVAQCLREENAIQIRDLLNQAAQQAHERLPDCPTCLCNNFVSQDYYCSVCNKFFKHKKPMKE